MRILLILSLLTNSFAFNTFSVHHLKKQPLIINNKIHTLLNDKLLNPPNNTLVTTAISTIALHGFTDLLHNKLTITRNYIISFLTLYKIKPVYRFYILVLFSVYHIRKDIGLIYSLILHIIWFFKPWLSVFYLSCIHVPMHYISYLENGYNTFLIFLYFFSLVIGIIIPPSYIRNNQNLWWLWLVIGHILTLN